jgi:D-aminopeptidase
VIDKGTGDGEGYTVAALIQSNYGIREHLVIGGVPVGRILKTGSAVKSSSGGGGRTKDGSIVVLVVTDAPLTTAQLDRMARHVTVGLSLVGSHSVGRNSSGDIFVALSTAPHGPETLEDEGRGITPSSISSYTTESIANASMNVFFVACAEAVEEAILNSMVGASSGTVGMDGTQIEGLPTEKVKDLLEKHLVKT